VYRFDSHALPPFFCVNTRGYDCKNLINPKQNGKIMKQANKIIQFESKNVDCNATEDPPPIDPELLKKNPAKRAKLYADMIHNLLDEMPPGALKDRTYTTMMMLPEFWEI
jgi:hypothetical protein